MDLEAPVLPPYIKLMSPAQWAQIAAAIGLVQASGSGFGEVRMLFEHGHPSVLHTTVAATLKDPDQVNRAIQRVQAATGGAGSVSVIVRNGHTSRIEVTTSEIMPMPLALKLKTTKSTHYSDGKT